MIGVVEVDTIPITVVGPMGLTVAVVVETATEANAIHVTEALPLLPAAAEEVTSRELMDLISITTATVIAVRQVLLRILICRRNLHFHLYLVWKLEQLLALLTRPLPFRLVRIDFVYCLLLLSCPA